MECRALAYDYNNFAGSWSAENRKLASTTLPFCFPPLLKYLCLFVYFYDFASMHKSVNVRQTTTDDGRWQADGGRDLITCSDKDTTDRTTWTTWALLLLLPKQVHRVSMFILRFNDYYQLLSNAAVKGANEGGRRERSHAPLPPPTTTTTPRPERKATTIPPQHHRGRRRTATTGRPTTDRIWGGVVGSLDNFGTAVGVACNHRWCKVQVGASALKKSGV